MENACSATPHALLPNCSHQSAPQVEPIVQAVADTTLRKENEVLKSELSRVNTILTDTLERVRDMENKYRKVLSKNGDERENHYKQEILALQTCVKYWPVQTEGRTGKYSKHFNGPCSESGLVPSATTSSVLRELPKETLEGLAKGESPEFLGVEKGSAIKRIGEVICETPAMRIRQQKLGSQKVRQQLHTAAILSHTAQAIALTSHIPRKGLLCA